MPRERILFVTGRLAEHALRRVPIARPAGGFDYDVAVLGISVAALMHADWVQRKLARDQEYDRVILPGWCQGDLAPLAEQIGSPVERGPKDLYDLPEHFGNLAKSPPDLSKYDIEILAEINHAPRLDRCRNICQAAAFRDSGADVIDLGCIPGESLVACRRGVTRCCATRGIASRSTVSTAAKSKRPSQPGPTGAELQRHQRRLGRGLGVEFVVIPDDPRELRVARATIEHSATAQACRFRVDPILEPIGFGFAASLARYFEVRRQVARRRMMMGIGNLTELTEVDYRRRQRAAGRLLPGTRHPQRADDGGHQLGPLGGAGVRPRPPAGALRASTSSVAQARRLALVMLRDPKVARVGRRRA